MGVALVGGRGITGGSSGIASFVEAGQIESEEDDDEQQQHIAAHVSAERDEIAWAIIVAEDLWTCEEESLDQTCLTRDDGRLMANAYRLRCRLTRQ